MVSYRGPRLLRRRRLPLRHGPGLHPDRDPRWQERSARSRRSSLPGEPSHPRDRRAAKGRPASRGDRARRGPDEADAGPVAPEEMSGEDRALLENTAAMDVWKMLAERYPDRRLA